MAVRQCDWVPHIDSPSIEPNVQMFECIPFRMYFQYPGKWPPSHRLRSQRKVHIRWNFSKEYKRNKTHFSMKSILVKFMGKSIDNEKCRHKILTAKVATVAVVVDARSTCRTYVKSLFSFCDWPFSTRVPYRPHSRGVYIPFGSFSDWYKS